MRALAPSEVWAASLVIPSSREETPVVAAVDDRLGRTTDRTIVVSGRRARDAADEIVLPRTSPTASASTSGTRSTSRPSPTTSSTRCVPDSRCPRADRRSAPARRRGSTGACGISPPRARRPASCSWARRSGARTTTRSSRTPACSASGSRPAPSTSSPRPSIAIARGHNATFDTGGLDTRRGRRLARRPRRRAHALLRARWRSAPSRRSIVLLTAVGRGRPVPSSPSSSALGHGHSERALAVALPMLPAVVGGSVGAVALAVARRRRWMPIGAGTFDRARPGFDVDGARARTRLRRAPRCSPVLVTVVARVVGARARRGLGSRPSGAATERSTRIAVGGDPVADARARRDRLADGAGPGPRHPGGTGPLGDPRRRAGHHRGRRRARRRGRHARSSGPTRRRGRTATTSSSRATAGSSTAPTTPSCAPVRTKLSADAGDRRRSRTTARRRCRSTAGARSSAAALGHIRGTIRPTILRGRAPVGAARGRAGREDAGRRTGRSIGDRVTVRGEQGRARVRIVGTTFFPAPNSHDTVTLRGRRAARAPARSHALDAGSFPQLVIRWRAGADVDRGSRAVRRDLRRARDRAGATTGDRPPPPGRGPPGHPRRLPRAPRAGRASRYAVGDERVRAAGATSPCSRRSGSGRRQIAGHHRVARGHGRLDRVGRRHPGRASWSAASRGAPWRTVSGSTRLRPSRWLLVVATVPVVLVVVLAIAAFPARRVRRLRPAVALRSE